MLTSIWVLFTVLMENGLNIHIMLLSKHPNRQSYCVRSYLRCPEMCQKIFARSSLGHFLNIIVKFGTVVMLSMLTDLKQIQLEAARIAFLICRKRMGKALYQKQSQKDAFFYDIVNSDTPLIKVLKVLVRRFCR